MKKRYRGASLSHCLKPVERERWIHQTISVVLTLGWSKVEVELDSSQRQNSGGSFFLDSWRHLPFALHQAYFFHHSSVLKPFPYLSNTAPFFSSYQSWFLLHAIEERNDGPLRYSLEKFQATQELHDLPSLMWCYSQLPHAQDSCPCCLLPRLVSRDRTSLCFLVYFLLASVHCFPSADAFHYPCFLWKWLQSDLLRRQEFSGC